MGLRHAIFIGQPYPFTAEIRSQPNNFDLIFGQFGGWVFLAFERSAPQSILQDHIFHVIQVCSQEKMINVDARWIVAFVAERTFQAGWGHVFLPIQDDESSAFSY